MLHNPSTPHKIPLKDILVQNGLGHCYEASREFTNTDTLEDFAILAQSDATLQSVGISDPADILKIKSIVRTYVKEWRPIYKPGQESGDQSTSLPPNDTSDIPLNPLSQSHLEHYDPPPGYVEANNNRNPPPGYAEANYNRSPPPQGVEPLNNRGPPTENVIAPQSNNRDPLTEYVTAGELQPRSPGLQSQTEVSISTAGLIFLALLFILIGITTDCWLTDEWFHCTYSEGLWKWCVNCGSESHCEYIDEPDVPLCIFAVGTLISGFYSLLTVFNPFNVWQQKFLPRAYASYVSDNPQKLLYHACFFTAGLAVMAAIIFFPTDMPDKVGYSFILFVVGAIFYVAAGYQRMKIIQGNQ